MGRNSRIQNPGTRFAGFLVAVLIALLILLLLASRYRKINPTPKLDRKGVISQMIWSVVEFQGSNPCT
jgi:high-affinity Fe2+/Pb2+ permease